MEQTDHLSDEDCGHVQDMVELMWENHKNEQFIQQLEDMPKDDLINQLQKIIDSQ